MAKVAEDRLNRYNDILQKNSKSTTFIKYDLFKVPENGTIEVRFLPGIEPGSADKDFFQKSLMHYNVSPDNPKIPVYCRKNLGDDEYCPVCKRVESLRASGEKVDLAEADKIKVSSRYYMAVIPREGPNANKVMVYPAPKKILQKILGLMPNKYFGDITDPNEGHDATISRMGKGRETEYDLVAAPPATSIFDNPKKQKEVLDNLPELWRYAVPPSAEEITALMEGKIKFFTTGGMIVSQESTEKQHEVEEEEIPKVDKADPAPVSKKKANISKLASMLEEGD